MVNEESALNDWIDEKCNEINRNTRTGQEEYLYDIIDSDSDEITTEADKKIFLSIPAWLEHNNGYVWDARDTKNNVVLLSDPKNLDD